MWHVSLFKSEIEKPLDIIKYVSWGGIFLKVYGVNISIAQLAMICLVSLFISFAGGIFLRRMGVVSYVTQLSNKQNPELLDIQKKVNGPDRPTT